MEPVSILQPVFAMGLLHIVMAIWMVVTRLPAMSKAGIDPQDAQNTRELIGRLPQETIRVSNNYNHLFEQPTLFYAVALAIAVLGHGDAFHVGCAWAYTGLRVVHSLVQATVDIVLLRFTLFALSWIALATMIVREALAIF